MTEDKDDSPDSKKTYRISTDNIITKPSLLSSPSTLGFFVIGMQGEQFKTWLWQGFIIDLALGYPAGKLLLYFKDKIHSLCRLDEA